MKNVQGVEPANRLERAPSKSIYDQRISNFGHHPREEESRYFSIEFQIPLYALKCLVSTGIVEGISFERYQIILFNDDSGLSVLGDSMRWRMGAAFGPILEGDRDSRFLPSRRGHNSPRRDQLPATAQRLGLLPA